ncbi:MAG: hypothetical protein FVQ81_13310 [Candidatus Glassbacteria bacterium]|nr:hypothetical protein [Candidatus Glassbacteria bacterium]
MINGLTYDWESVTITLPTGMVFEAQDIEYSDEKEITPVYGKGGMARAYGRGNYKAEGKLTLLRSELVALTAAAGTFEIPPLPIAVSFSNEDQSLQLDLLKDCKLKKRSFRVAQGDQTVPVEVEFEILGGVWLNGVPPQSQL